MSKSVLVGTVTSDAKKYCLDKYIAGINSIDYDNFRHIVVDTSEDPNYRQELFERGVWSVKDTPCSVTIHRITSGQNKLRELAINGNFDYLLLIDSDWVVRPDIIKRLVSHGKDFVSGMVKLKTYIGDDIHTKICFWSSGIDPDMAFRGIITAKWMDEENVNKGLVEWEGCGLGAALISRKLLIACPFQYWIHATENYYPEIARRNGFKHYIDTSVLVDHYPEYKKEGLLWQKSEICLAQRSALTV